MAYGSFTSKLEAVNQMLSTIGQSRISQLASAGEANDAQKILEEIDKAVQSEGWHFNQIPDVELPLGTVSFTHSNSGANITTTVPHYLVKDEKVLNGTDNLTAATITSTTAATLSGTPSQTKTFYSERIGVPTDALDIDLSIYSYQGIDPVTRGKFLFDKKNNTYFFGSKVKAIVTYLLPFETTNETGESVLPEYARRYITMKAARVFAQRHVGDPQLVQMASLEEREARMNLIHKESENADYSIFNSPLSNYTVTRDATSSISYTTTG